MYNDTPQIDTASILIIYTLIKVCETFCIKTHKNLFFYCIIKKSEYPKSVAYRTVETISKKPSLLFTLKI